jgi:hypothetical protein
MDDSSNDRDRKPDFAKLHLGLEDDICDIAAMAYIASEAIFAIIGHGPMKDAAEPDLYHIMPNQAQSILFCTRHLDDMAAALLAKYNAGFPGNKAIEAE